MAFLCSGRPSNDDFAAVGAYAYGCATHVRTSAYVRLVVAAIVLGSGVTPGIASAAPRGEMIFTDGHRAPARALAPDAGKVGDGWRRTVDQDTGAIATMIGSHVYAPGSSSDPAIAERAAKQFLAAHLAELAPGLSPSDLVVIANTLDEHAIRSVGFEQRWRGLRVVGGQLGVVFAHDRLFAITSQLKPHLAAVMPRSAPRGERVVLAASGGFQVVDRTRDGEWEVYRGEHGEVARQSVLRDASGTLAYNAGVRYASGPRSDTPARTANLTVDGAPTMTSTTGVFSWAGSATATVAPTCMGSEITVSNAAGTAATTTLTVQPNGGVIWSAANSELEDAQVSTYVYGTIAAERAKRLDPAAATWLAPFVFYVNEANPCNAFSDGDSVHLARSVTGCENTGRVADIVFHEFGHAVHFHELIAGVGAFEAQLTEGLADFYAADITEDSGIGRGLDLTDAPVRDIDPSDRERVYPHDLDVDAHISGEIVSGALWDLRKALIAELGHDAAVAVVEKVFVGVLRRASDLPSSYVAALIADDDDGDLGNGTPHHCELQRAFGVHGLADDFSDVRVGSPTLVDAVFTVPVTPGTASACPARQVARMHLLWKVGESVVNDLELAPAGDGRSWTAAIPPQADGTVVMFSVDVTLDDGTAVPRPDNPADPMYQAFVGTPTPIYCTTFESDPHWTKSGDLTNPWQYSMPSQFGYESGDPVAPHTGFYVEGTNLFNTGVYPPGESAAITTPLIDTSAYQLIHLQYWRWLSVQDGDHDRARIIGSTDTMWQNSSAVNHLDKEWRFQDLDLTPHLDHGQIAVTWQLDTDGTVQFGGWNLDDVCIVGLTKLEVCGDNVLEPGEVCDDGNTADGDGCSSTCHDELTAGGGGCCSASGDPSGLFGIVIFALARGLGRGRGRRRRARRSAQRFTAASCCSST